MVCSDKRGEIEGILYQFLSGLQEALPTATLSVLCLSGEKAWAGLLRIQDEPSLLRPSEISSPFHSCTPFLQGREMEEKGGIKARTWTHLRHGSWP